MTARNQADKASRGVKLAKVLASAVILATIALAESPIAQQSIAAPPRSATLAQQKSCDEQARKKFYEDYPEAERSARYTSHFDQRINVCYVLVRHTAVNNDVPVVSAVVYDALEGREYASYIWINAQGLKYWEVDPTECVVKPRGQAEVNCRSEDEFDRLIDEYFGIGR